MHIWVLEAIMLISSLKSPTELALIARIHSNRQRNILGQKLVKEAQCSLRLSGCIPEDDWLTTEDR